MKHYRVIIISTVYLLLICVYFPTNYHTSASCDAFIDVLSELEDFIDSVPFQHTIIEAILMLISLHITILFLKTFFMKGTLFVLLCFPLPVLIILMRVMLAELILGSTNFVCDEPLFTMIHPVTSLNCGSKAGKKDHSLLTLLIFISLPLWLLTLFQYFLVLLHHGYLPG